MTPLCPAPNKPALTGRIEAMFRRARAIEDKNAWRHDAIQDACSSGSRASEAIVAAADAADEERYALLDDALRMPIETVMDALLVVAASSFQGRLVAGSDLSPKGAAHFIETMRATRRAADFLATHLGCDMAPILGADFDIEEDAE